ncbi:MAG TPA: alpha/beta fold hydrolase, partial [Anaeromyxobacteraceae bacterium]|nr:alpha/beta fold hydrolase [Anaeromyxobacteraceae bacterium]
QVKIRGFRIEPGEVEAALCALPGVSQAAVVPWPGTGGEVKLVAYVMAAAGALVDLEALRRALGERLPDYMVPAALVLLDTLPLTPNGKLDRKALPHPELAAGTPVVAPTTETEALVCTLFAEVTGAHDIGIDHGFFALGGHSLTAKRLVTRLRAQTGKDIPLRALFEHPTPRDLAPIIDRGPQQHSYTPLLPLRRTGTRPPLFCVHPASGMATCYRDLASHLDPDIPVWGLQARGLEAHEQPQGSIDEMAQTYLEAILAIQPTGPFHLLGWSFGGRIAHAMACKLEERAKKVALLVLLDTPTDGASPQQADDIDRRNFEDLAQLAGLDPDKLPEDRDQCLGLLLQAAIATGILPTGTPIDTANRIVDNFRNAASLTDRHNLGRSHAAILLLRAGRQPEYPEFEPIFAWENHTLSEVTRVTIDSTHHGMMQDQQAHDIAQHINGSYGLAT